MLIFELVKQFGDQARFSCPVAGGEHGVEGIHGRIGDFVEDGAGISEHLGSAVADDERGEEGFVMRDRIGIPVRLD